VGENLPINLILINDGSREYDRMMSYVRSVGYANMTHGHKFLWYPFMKSNNTSEAIKATLTSFIYCYCKLPTLNGNSSIPIKKTLECI
ncbi:MAG TPA: hypothetical protein VIP56_06485, partial [Nitrososphaeraceae archaeon]